MAVRNTLGGKKSKNKIAVTMREFKKGTLHSGSKKGPKVTNRKQAVAIALSQARKEAKPNKFQDGGAVQQGGQATVHAGEQIVPKNPDIYLGVKNKPPKQKPFVPFGGDPPKNRPTKKETRDEINAIRKSAPPDSEEGQWMFGRQKAIPRSKRSI